MTIWHNPGAAHTRHYVIPRMHDLVGEEFRRVLPLVLVLHVERRDLLRESGRETGEVAAKVPQVLCCCLKLLSENEPEDGEEQKCVYP